MTVTDRTYEKSHDMSNNETQSVPLKRNVKKLPSLKHVPKLPKKSITPYELNSNLDRSWINSLPAVKKVKSKRKKHKKRKNAVEKRRLSNSALDMYTMDQLYGVKVLHTVYK